MNLIPDRKLLESSWRTACYTMQHIGTFTHSGHSQSTANVFHWLNPLQKGHKPVNLQWSNRKEGTDYRDLLILFYYFVLFSFVSINEAVYECTNVNEYMFYPKNGYEKACKKGISLNNRKENKFSFIFLNTLYYL